MSVLTRSTWVARAYLVVCSRVILRARRFSNESERCLASVGGTGQTGTQPSRVEIASSRTKLRCAHRGRVFPAYIKILLLWCRVRWIMVSQLRFTLLPFSFLFFFLLFLPLLFSFIPCLPRIHRKAYTRGSSNERMQIVATTLSVIFLMPS